MIPRGNRYLWPSFLYLIVIGTAVPSSAFPAGPAGLSSNKDAEHCRFLWTSPTFKFSRGRVDNQIDDPVYYNLCPLIDDGAPIQVVDRIAEGTDAESRGEGGSGGMSMDIRYVFNFGSAGSVVEEFEECSGRTWTCLTNNDRKGFLITDNVQAGSSSWPPSAKTSLSSTTPRPVEPLHSADPRDDMKPSFVWTAQLDALSPLPQDRVYAQVYFKCELTENSSLTFLAEEREGGLSIHSFIWATQHACGSAMTNGHHEAANQIGTLQNQDGLPSEDQPPEDESGSGEEQDLIPPTQKPQHHIIRVLFFVGLTIAIISVVIIYRPSVLPAPLRPLLFIPVPHSPLARFSVKSRRRAPPDNGGEGSTNRRFRVDEDSLVRWAQEDLSLEAEGELDVMVNGAEDAGDQDDGDRYTYGYGYGAAGVGRTGAEYIPLKPSPFIGTGQGKGTKWGAKAGYGSVIIGR